MARLYRTPDVLHCISRKSKQHDIDGYLLPDDELREESIEVHNTEYKLLKALDDMLKDSDKKITKSHLMKVTHTYGKHRYKYDYIFDDLIEMLNKYELHTVPKGEDEKGIPDYEELKTIIGKKTTAFMLGPFDKLDFLYDIEDHKELLKKAEEVIDAYFAFGAGNYHIHPDFIGCTINDMFQIICKKYERIKILEREYKELKEELQ